MVSRCETCGMDSEDMIKRRAAVEIYLLSCYEGRKPLPDKEKCKELALDLGTPSSLRYPPEG